MTKYVWVTHKLVEALNALGYTHFNTKTQAEPTIYKEGRAFYYDDTTKEYGYVDVIPYIKVETCKDNEEFILKQYELFRKGK